MILNQRDNRHEAVIQAGLRMMTAARTAPKARGLDLIEVAIVSGDDLNAISAEMLRLHEETGRPVFKRDSANILQGDALILIGTRRQPIGLNCGHCGFPTCGSKPAEVPCAFNTIDTGIAVGSACSMAADMRIDTRVMYSAGMAAMRLDMLPGCGSVLAIALSATSKNPFFDRG
ncbi:MAG: ferredoxin [Muribaculaceae bacterium]|nr:ferredoxin [Muribaculaceae bacterium]